MMLAALACLACASGIARAQTLPWIDGFMGTMDAGWSWTMEDPSKHSFLSTQLRLIVGPTQAGTPNVTNSLRRNPPAGGRYSMMVDYDYPAPYNSQRIRLLLYSDDTHYATLEWRPTLPGGSFSGKDGANSLFWEVRTNPYDTIGLLSLGFDPAHSCVTVLMGEKDSYTNYSTPIYSTFPVSFVPTRIGIDPVGPQGTELLVDHFLMVSWPYLSPSTPLSVDVGSNARSVTVKWSPSPTPSPSMKQVVTLSGGGTQVKSPSLGSAVTQYTFNSAPCSDPAQGSAVALSDIYPDDLVRIPEYTNAYTGPWHIGEFNSGGLSAFVSCVGYLNQGKGPWKSFYYDHTPDDPIFGPRTIQQKGCAVTATAMLLNYLGIWQGNGNLWDPGTLDDYLALRDDGFSGSNLWWSGGVSEILGVPFKKFATPTPGSSQNADIDAELAAGRPVPIDVGHHWVLVTGLAAHDGHLTYAIDDPGYSDRHYLDHPAYNNTFKKAVIYDWGGSGPLASQTLSQGGVWIDAYNVTSVEVTDPIGRSSDGSSGTTIPSLGRSQGTGLFDDAGPDSLQALDPDFKSLWMPGEVGGTYGVRLAGPPGAAIKLVTFVPDSLGHSGAPIVQTASLDANGAAEVSLNVPGATTSIPPPQSPTAFGLKILGSPSHSGLTVEFGLPQDASIEMVFFDVQGRRRASLATGTYAAGEHKVSWSNAGQLSAGVYFVELRALGRRIVRRVYIR